MRSILFLVLVLLFLPFIPTFAQNRGPDENRSGLLDAPKTLDDYWDDRFDLPGLDAAVNQVAVGSNGNLYVQTVSRLTGNVRSASVYRWNGGGWNSLLDSNGWAHVDGMVLEPQRIVATAGETLYVAMERRYDVPLSHPVSEVEPKQERTDGMDLSVQPNPASGSVRLGVHLARLGRVRMDISTEDGREVGEIVNGEYGEGDHSISWEISGLPVGVYQVRLHVGEFLVSRKLVIIR